MLYPLLGLRHFSFPVVCVYVIKAIRHARSSEYCPSIWAYKVKDESSVCHRLLFVLYSFPHIVKFKSLGLSGCAFSLLGRLSFSLLCSYGVASRSPVFHLGLSGVFLTLYLARFVISADHQGRYGDTRLAQRIPFGMLTQGHSEWL